MTPQTNITDTVGLAVFIVGYVFPDEAAQLFGPYLVIFAAATLGASWATIRRESLTRLGAILFFARVIGLALLVSVPIAQHLSMYYQGATVRATLAFVAFAVGVIGDDWPNVIRIIIIRSLGAFGLRSKTEKVDNDR